MRMEWEVQKAIDEITYRSRKFPEEPFRILSEKKEEAIRFLICFHKMKNPGNQGFHAILCLIKSTGTKGQDVV